MALDIRESKRSLSERIKRRFGYPVVKVELDPQQIFDAIDYAREKWIKWATGNATSETWFTTLLRAGQNFYDLPIGVKEVVEYDDRGAYYGGVNTLFSIENFLYNRGILDSVLWGNGGWEYGYNLVSYHLVLDFFATVKRYTPTIYNYKYHRYTNQIEVHPAPPSGQGPILALDENGNEVEVDSPGYILLRTFMIEGSHYGGMETDPKQATWKRGDSDENFYTSDWIFDYALAECKIILGTIRRKFGGFTSIGNTGIDLDGAELVAEGKEEKLALEETLRLEEVHEGYPIFWG
jgi:hypothetical protein